jgi:hypothetical protein
MPFVNTLTDNNILDQINLSAIANPGDKLRECEYFYGLAATEVDRNKFRWLVSAFLNAAYSFFESSALSTFVRFTNPETGEAIEDMKAVETLQKYVKIKQSKNNPYYVKTQASHPVTDRLYKYRSACTHHFPLSIMAGGPFLPEDYQFGYLRDKGVPVLALCRDALSLIRKVEGELEQ